MKNLFCLGCLAINPIYKFVPDNFCFSINYINIFTDIFFINKFDLLFYGQNVFVMNKINNDLNQFSNFYLLKS